MLIHKLREKGFEGDLYLWTAYNEGIHTLDYSEMKHAYIGFNIHEKD